MAFRDRSGLYVMKLMRKDPGPDGMLVEVMLQMMNCSDEGVLLCG